MESFERTFEKYIFFKFKNINLNIPPTEDAIAHPQTAFKIRSDFLDHVSRVLVVRIWFKGTLDRVLKIQRNMTIAHSFSKHK